MNLSPSEDLMAQVLATRWRLGEKCWTFGTDQRRTARTLETKGGCTWKSGVVEKTIIVWPSNALLEDYLDQTYEPPAFASSREVKKYLAYMADAQEYEGSGYWAHQIRQILKGKVPEKP